MEETASAAEVHVSLLGGFSVTVNGQPVPDRWRLRKAKTLVKLLALAPGIGCTATSWWIASVGYRAGGRSQQPASDRMP
jgi:hypothetical protein